MRVYQSPNKPLKINSLEESIIRAEAFLTYIGAKKTEKGWNYNGCLKPNKENFLLYDQKICVKINYVDEFWCDEIDINSTENFPDCCKSLVINKCEYLYEINHLPYTNRLVIKQCENLTSINAQIKELTEFEEVYIIYTNLNKIPEFELKNNSIETLHLTNNKISCIENLPNCEILNLTNNNLKSFISDENSQVGTKTLILKENENLSKISLNENQQYEYLNLFDTNIKVLDLKHIKFKDVRVSNIDIIKNICENLYKLYIKDSNPDLINECTHENEENDLYGLQLTNSALKKSDYKIKNLTIYEFNNTISYYETYEKCEEIVSYKDVFKNNSKTDAETNFLNFLYCLEKGLSEVEMYDRYLKHIIDKDVDVELLDNYYFPKEIRKKINNIIMSKRGVDKFLI